MTSPDTPFELDLAVPPARPDARADGVEIIGQPFGVDPGVPADPDLLARNLAMLAPRQPALARRIAQTPPHDRLRFIETDENGVLSVELDDRALASRRRPLTEARRLAERVDIHAHAGLVVMGMGVGHHVGALHERASDACALIVFEPDLALLRAVLERVDHTAWLAHKHTRIVTDPDDVGALTADLHGTEALMSLGIELVEHAPSAARLGDAPARMAKTVTSAIGAMRMHVITAMMQADVTARNELMNLGHYIARPGIADLRDLCAGRPAILVAAGPSLRTSIELLKEPGVRERCVIIAVQTVLKPLLEAGIKPHFVTAIDYHEISKRFYEGLTREDVEGVTLVVEARANAAILDAFPGDIRIPRDDFLDHMLSQGPEHDGADRGKLRAAATVAHLSYYLARWLGCDPAILVGQDLAFTDGQYYGPHAAIHNVWAPELNPANSLECMEWQRIVRHRRHLHRVTDVMGRPVFTDDQMAAYLAQFERDFAPDAQRGLRIIDASEGVAKRHTTALPLPEALAQHAGDYAPSLPDIPGAPENASPSVRRATADLARKVRRQTRLIARHALDAADILEELKADQRDKKKNREAVERVHSLRAEVEQLQPAYRLLMKMNQLGGFKRFRADRAIALAEHEDTYAEQLARIERDIVNLRWIEEYAGVFAELLTVSERAIHGGEKRTRDHTPKDPEAHAKNGAEVRVGAVIDAEMGARDETNVRATIARLRKARTLDAIVLLTAHPERFNDLKPDVIIHQREPADERTRRALRAGRAWARDAWRSGLACLSAADETLEPDAIKDACATHRLDAAYIVGPDWVCLDPRLTDEVVERHTESPDANPITFTQAPPGLCGVVVRRDGIDGMAEGRAMTLGSAFATLGGVFGYVPLAPRSDPIAKPGCVQIDAALRDHAVCAIADTPATMQLVRDASELADPIDIASRLAHAEPDAPSELVLEITTRRAHVGPRYERLVHGEMPQRSDMTRDIACAIIDVFAHRSPGGLLSFEGLGDPMLIDHTDELIARAKGAGLLVHVRTDLLTGDAVDRLLACAPDIVSIDTLATEARTYEHLVGVDALERVHADIERLINERAMTRGLPEIWVVPRITRCDAVYEQIERFYDGWLTRCAAAIIDPLLRAAPGERIAPLPVPAPARERLRRTRCLVRADGVVTPNTDWLASAEGPATTGENAIDLWRATLARRSEAA